MRKRRKRGEVEIEAFRPAGFWLTLGFVCGVPVLLFLDAAFFVFSPFDFFDRWIDPILTGSLAGGLLWGVAAARNERARIALVAFHCPLVFGTVCFVFALLLGALLHALGVTETVAKIVGAIGFWCGFVFGCVAIVAWCMDLFSDAPPRSASRT
jgi:hypothetical protein